MRLPRLSLSEFFLRIALAGSVLYPPFDALTDPYSWVGYFPGFLSDLVAPHQLVLLHTFGIVEVVLAIWLLIGKRIKVPACIMAVLLLSIAATNLTQFSVLFRDVALALAALALVFYDRPATPRNS
jgi:uncharacterized membrane protein YphA (DoxX/SURF4 family)